MATLDVSGVGAVPFPGSSRLLSPKPLKWAETGSPFDTTRRPLTSARAGAHLRMHSPVHLQAFSATQRGATVRPQPLLFLKKRGGIGGGRPKTAAALFNPRRPGPRPEATRCLAGGRTRIQAPAGGGAFSPAADVALGGNRSSPRRTPRRARAKNRSPITMGPPKAGAFRQRANPPDTAFRRSYERGDLPLFVDHSPGLLKLAWRTELEHLDYANYLPVMFDGLREVERPYSFLAERGVVDMIQQGGERILPIIPKLITPIKTALNTRNVTVVVRTLKVLQKLVVADVTDYDDPDSGRIGKALVPYYRQILPIFNLFVNRTRSSPSCDEIDFAQRKNQDVGKLVHETLELFEFYGQLRRAQQKAPQINALYI